MEHCEGKTFEVGLRVLNGTIFEVVHRTFALRGRKMAQNDMTDLMHLMNEHAKM